MKNKKTWLFYAIITTIFWGLWGALIEIPENHGFPPTLGYSIWALTMIPPAVVALWNINWELEYDIWSIIWGSLIGLTGAGGQLILFEAVRNGPAYLIFPLVSLSPVITIILALILLKEKTGRLGWIGIVLALIAIFFLSYQKPGSNAHVHGYLWLIFSLCVFFAWGVQAYFMRFANQSMKAESIFFYMMVTALILIPFAIWMTDFSQPINWGFSGPYAEVLIQILNSIGALCLVYAFRYGKAIVVSPLANAVAPVITVIISLIIYSQIPNTITIIGIILAISATLLLGYEEEVPDEDRLDEDEEAAAAQKQS
ncbi:MAG TPA: EamA family transporter [Balneolaceae bacterium]|nr:EamA family transporter [Balneolaceae bacterium]